MKVDSSYVENGAVHAAYREMTVKCGSDDKVQRSLAGSQRGDTVRLSPSSGVVSALNSVVSEIGDIRADRVEPLRTSVENGAYHIPPATIAAAMYRNMAALGNE